MRTIKQLYLEEFNNLKRETRFIRLLDSTYKFRIKQILQLVQENKMVILIAHRLSTVVNANEIIVLQDGRVIEHAPHAALLAQKGYCYRMRERQIPLHRQDLVSQLADI